jgi:hypothetical protein
MDGDADDGADSTAEVRNTKSQLKAAIGAKFESLFEKMLTNVKKFVFFCNLVNILAVGPAATTKVKIQIRGFLQLGKATALTVLEKLLSHTLSVSVFLSAK